MNTSKNTLCARMLDVIEQDIVPLTQAAVASGNKIFGAAILNKADLSLVIAGTNGETQNPLYHGEIATLNAFYNLPEADRPATKDCLFIATHEPCSLCLSAITWTGFDNFYYFFGYEDTRDAFNIPHDLKILQEVFNIPDGEYSRNNEFWQSQGLIAMAGEAIGPELKGLVAQIERIKAVYDELSTTYQASKGDTAIPLN